MRSRMRFLSSPLICQIDRGSIGFHRFGDIILFFIYFFCDRNGFNHNIRLEDTMTKKKSPKSLYKLCMEETFSYLVQKIWNGGETNPFSQINCNIVNDLFKFIVFGMKNGTPRPLKLLLKSGQLQDLILDGLDFTEEQWRSVMKYLLEEGDSCRNITYISVNDSFQNAEQGSLERLIEKCPLLEILHTMTYFNLSALKNCLRLKNVTSYYSGLKEYRYFWNESVDTLANLQNLKKFDIFQCRNSSSYYKHIAKMLQNHPKLVSLGDTDSSWAAHHIYTTCRMDIVPRFGLKKCFWGFNKNVEEFYRQQTAYIQQFPVFVKSSVVLFPLVEKLLIIVYHEDCIQHLKKLKHLRVLEIDFSLCCGLPARTAFISLLSEIGPQLKGLSILDHKPMPVDVIMKYCSNVVQMDLRCKAIVQGGIETDSHHFRQLEKLLLNEMDAESLEYLLRNSLKLKELLLVDALCVDDTLLHKILKKNYLSQLNTIAVYECRLSREGLKELVQKCANLEIAAFETLDADMMIVAKELERDIRAAYFYVEQDLTAY
ncbi:uncharacterized protein CDAR_252981 [Caerostris darwini]|uniref:Uncharacterized protein n=1 Tax=Caerostris darwini TaxID=1538125 RepID=A0AAV4Q575_9ARAC|nr:uncharacterized protein CDAR_252981 [Caerostris darwini]